MARMRSWIRWDVVVRGRRVRVGKSERIEIRIW
jgi:hypothetical protein